MLLKVSQQILGRWIKKTKQQQHCTIKVYWQHSAQQMLFIKLIKNCWHNFEKYLRLCITLKPQQLNLKSAVRSLLSRV